jgi:hypothetical protein
MRKFNLLIAAGAAVALAACGSEPAVNNTSGNEVDANMMLEEPANDASAMESMGNATETAPVDNTVSNETEETDGGDTGGNNVESNTVGM